MAEIIEIKGLLFNSKCQVLVNTVNCEGVMGGGIALEFKLRFPEEMFLKYEKKCNEGLLKPGKLMLYDKNEPWILNFPTKDKWKLPSKISYIKSGLEKFCSTYKVKKIKSIAFPRLGVSSGHLDWEIVREEMYKYLSPLDDLYVEIYNFDPMDNNIKDKLYLQLKEKVNSLSDNEIRDKLSIRDKQVDTLLNIIKNHRNNKMFILQKTKGIGKRSLKNIYDFAINENQISNYHELKLF